MSAALQTAPTQQPYNASPSSTSSRRQTNRNGATSNNSQPQYYSPTGSSQTPVTSRMVNAVSPTGSSDSPTINSHPDRSRGGGPVAPPRTSSNQRSTGPAVTAAVSAATRASTKVDERQPNSPRMPVTGDGQEREISNGRTTGSEGSRDDAVAAANAASRSRRRTEQDQQLPFRPTSSRDASNPTSRSSRQATSATSPPGPTREPSEVINRLVVSSPEVDVERERIRLLEVGAGDNDAAVANSETKEETPRRRQDHSSSKREKTSKFGEYFLGSTLGEGEFGKVKMGWKQSGGPDVAIKLIRKESVGSNPTRLAKIYREIAILREISHPHIVRLHEKVETERHIGIILEYASGGELFDYILLHRYLKDQHARRLFAQLISGVGYLHKKGIVHRDLKLENLLLDRNRNIIITDFGFANTFNAVDELGDEIEYNLGSRDYVKRMELDKILSDGHRRGDLMQTSCGSPCYAAPELVVSDSLYTGRKVDVWSCGVILYAMLAGYLPFDDDPANPEGDNINLLYKYIVSTPLTFPEYVTPHARDLLRRILVPDPRKRADLFEVARHSWLSEYSQLVSGITSSTTTPADIASTATAASEEQEVPLLNRSTSVKESTKTQKPQTTVGELGRKHGNVDPDDVDIHKKKDSKRRTVQVEYVPPRSETVRGAPPISSNNVPPRSRGRSGSQGEIAIPRKPISTEKPLPHDPLSSAGDKNRRPSSSQKPQAMAPPTRPGRDAVRSASDAGYVNQITGPSIARPPTGNSMASTTSLGLVARGSYGQPVAPKVAGTNVQGRMSQPSQSRSYQQPPSNDAPQASQEFSGRPTVPAKFAKVSGFTEPGRPDSSTTKSSHKRSNTVGSFTEKLFGRSGSIFGGRKDQQERNQEKKYPPVSMSGKIIPADGENPRRSVESRRSISFGFNKKRSGSIAGSSDGKHRRMSLLPTSWSLKAIGIGKDSSAPGTPPYDQQSEDQQLGPDQPVDAPNIDRYQGDAGYDSSRDSPVQENRRGAPPAHMRYTSQPTPRNAQMSGAGNIPQHHAANQFRQGESALTTESDSSIDHYSQSQSQRRQQQQQQQYPSGFNETPANTNARNGVSRGVLQKNHRKFVDAYESKPEDGTYSKPGRTAGSSGAARKVMDFFRRKGNDRTNDV